MIDTNKKLNQNSDGGEKPVVRFAGGVSSKIKMPKKVIKKKKTATKKLAPKSSNKTKQAKPKRQRQHTVAEYKKAIQQSNGILVNISEMLSVTRGAVTLFLNNHPQLRELVNQKRESWIDKAEDEMFNLIEFQNRKDPVPAARVRQKSSEFILSRLGRHRGYVEKSEVSLSGGTDNKIEVEIIEIQRSDDENPDN